VSQESRGDGHGWSQRRGRLSAEGSRGACWKSWEGEDGVLGGEEQGRFQGKAMHRKLFHQCTGHRDMAARRVECEVKHGSPSQPVFLNLLVSSL
jgi:hypothetical protein